MYYYNDKPLPLDKAFTDINSIQYPANWLRNSTQAQRDALGITWVAPNPESSYDQRFYWSVDNPKDIDELKKQWITKQKSTAASLLAPTDWYLIRQTEVSEEVCPPEVLQERADIREVSGQRENQINACANTKDLETLITAQATIEVVVEQLLPETDENPVLSVDIETESNEISQEQPLPDTDDNPVLPVVIEIHPNPDALIPWPNTGLDY